MLQLKPARCYSTLHYCFRLKVFCHKQQTSLYAISLAWNLTFWISFPSRIWNFTLSAIWRHSQRKQEEIQVGVRPCLKPARYCRKGEYLNVLCFYPATTSNTAIIKISVPPAALYFRSSLSLLFLSCHPTSISATATIYNFHRPTGNSKATISVDYKLQLPHSACNLISTLTSRMLSRTNRTPKRCKFRRLYSHFFVLDKEIWANKSSVLVWSISARIPGNASQ